MRNAPYVMRGRIPHVTATEKTGCCCFCFGFSWKVSHLNQFLTEPLFNFQTNWKVPNLIKCWNLKKEKKKSTDNRNICMLRKTIISATWLSVTIEVVILSVLWKDRRIFSPPSFSENDLTRYQQFRFFSLQSTSEQTHDRYYLFKSYGFKAVMISHILKISVTFTSIWCLFFTRYSLLWPLHCM